jgi:hypothetical protein
MPGFSVLGMTIQPTMVALFILAFTLGMCVPFRYGIERLRGFGRAGLSKLPYKPPDDAPEGTDSGGNGKSRDEKRRFK